MGYLRRLPRFEYVAPRTVDEVCSFLAERGGEARLFAGGTDLVLQMKRREIAPRLVIGLKGVAALASIRSQPGGIAIGAMATFGAIESSSLVRERHDVLCATAAGIGSPEIRAVATIGGNVSGALPCADFAAPLMTLGARVMGHSASTALVNVHEDGTVALVTGSTDVGQGADTVLSMIAAEVLGVRMEDIRFALVDTDMTPADPGTFSSRVTFWTGNAVKLAAEDARQQLAEIAAEKLKAEAKDIMFRDRRVYVTDDPQRCLRFEELVRLAQHRLGKVIMGKGSYTSGDALIDFRTGYGNMSPAYTPSACVVEVDVDPQTGQVTVTGIWGAHDCGFPLNPMLVNGQILGATVMGIGQALYENLIRTDGKVMNPSFRDYKMPLTEDMPMLVNVGHVNVITNDPSGPFGAKEAGEGAAAGVIAAVANAIHDATGVRFRSLPFSPDKILFALKNSSGKAQAPHETQAKEKP